MILSSTPGNQWTLGAEVLNFWLTLSSICSSLWYLSLALFIWYPVSPVIEVSFMFTSGIGLSPVSLSRWSWSCSLVQGWKEYPVQERFLFTKNINYLYYCKSSWYEWEGENGNNNNMTNTKNGDTSNKKRVKQCHKQNISSSSN